MRLEDYAKSARTENDLEEGQGRKLGSGMVWGAATFFQSVEGYGTWLRSDCEVRFERTVRHLWNKEKHDVEDEKDLPIDRLDYHLLSFL